MGYSSEAVFAVRKDCYLATKLTGQCPEWLNAEETYNSNLEDALGSDEEQIIIYFPIYGKVTKLCKEFEEYMNLLEDMYEEYNGSLASYVRIGESLDDIEHSGPSWDMGLDIHRTISTPYFSTDPM